jgi:hypothetical protein
MPHPLDLADVITPVLLFLLALFLLGFLIGLAHMWWRATHDRLEQAKEGEGSTPNARSPDPRAGHSSRGRSAVPSAPRVAADTLGPRPKGMGALVELPHQALRRARGDNSWTLPSNGRALTL